MITMLMDFPSDVYTTINYPGGEKQVRLNSLAIETIHECTKIEIKARVKSTWYFIELLLLADAIRGVKPDAEIDLILPYLPYARADRRFVDGDCHGLETFGRLLKTARFNNIFTLDVHNKRAAYTHVSSFLHDKSPLPYIRESIHKVAFATRYSVVTVLLPDVGAAKRYNIEMISKVDSIDMSIVYAAKTRNPSTGSFIGFQVPSIDPDRPVLIVDDICDGGGTFIGIAEALRRDGYQGQLNLYVTHGLFSQGIGKLAEYFDRIYTTDSYHALGTNHSNIAHVFDAFDIKGLTG